jgi:hypothetical protein
VTAHIGRARNPDLVLHGSGRIITRLMLGKITLAQARKQGLKLEGDTKLLKRLRVRQPAG